MALDDTGTRIADFELLHMVDADLQEFQVQLLVCENRTANS